MFGQDDKQLNPYSTHNILYFWHMIILLENFLAFITRKHIITVYMGDFYLYQVVF